MRNGPRCFLLALVGVLMLAVSPAALGDESTYELVFANPSGNCFLIEKLDGTTNGCSPRPAVGVINTGYSVAADGTVVFVAADNIEPRSGTVGSIWLARRNLTSVHLDASIWDFDATISYDGSKVVFARFDPATGSSDIYSVQSDGSHLQLVVSGGGTSFLRTPAISPDGSTIAYWCGPAGNPTNPPLTCGPLADGSYRSGGLMRVNFDGTNPRLILIGPGDALADSGPSELSWSPDAQWLTLDGQQSVYLGNNTYTAQAQLYRYRSDGSDLFNNLDPARQITHVTAPHTPAFPQFSPDGAELLFRDTVDDNGNSGNFAYSVNVDGTNRHQVAADYGAFIPTAVPGAPPALSDPTQITVPSVVNFGLFPATLELQKEGLAAGTVTYAHSDTVAANSVISQDPSPGAVVPVVHKQGPPVNLVVSSGPPPPPPPSVSCVVPGVKGKRLSSAKQAIAAAHCSVGRIKLVFSRTARKGRVISQRPAKGSRLAEGAKVALTVSKGKR